MSKSFIKTSVKSGFYYFSVEPDENEGLMDFFVESRYSDNVEDISYVDAVLTPDDLEYLANRILDAVNFYRKHHNAE